MPATTTPNASSNSQKIQKWFSGLSLNLRRFSWRPSPQRHATTSVSMLRSPTPSHDRDQGSLHEQVSIKFHKNVRMISSLQAAITHERVENKNLSSKMDQTIRKKEQEIIAGKIAFQEMADLLKIKEAEAVELASTNMILKRKLHETTLSEADSIAKATSTINDLTQMVDLLKQELMDADNKREELSEAGKMPANAMKKSDNFQGFLERELINEKAKVDYLLNETIKARLEIWHLKREKKMNQHQHNQTLNEFASQLIDDFQIPFPVPCKDVEIEYAISYPVNI